MRRYFFFCAVMVAVVFATVVLAGCGGSSSSSGSGGGGRHAITASECQRIRLVMDDLESFVTGGGLDYIKDTATIDNFGDTVAFPSTVSDSYTTWQGAVDKIASAMKDVGVKPNDTPLTSQLDELNSKFHGSDSLNKAGATVRTWADNGCD
jgi:hypothetical protein